MERAKKLLLSTSLSLADIAEQSGYGDYRVFTKVFKKSESITPLPVPAGFSGHGVGSQAMTQEKAARAVRSRRRRESRRSVTAEA